MRLAPRLEVHVARRIRLDLDEPRNVDVRPVLANGARATRACATRGRELLVVDFCLVLAGEGEDEGLRVTTRVQVQVRVWIYVMCR